MCLWCGRTCAENIRSLRSKEKVASVTTFCCLNQTAVCGETEPSATRRHRTHTWEERKATLEVGAKAAQDQASEVLYQVREVGVGQWRSTCRWGGRSGARLALWSGGGCGGHSRALVSGEGTA